MRNGYGGAIFVRVSLMDTNFAGNNRSDVLFWILCVSKNA
jgi:hypothetical protein